jgi:acetyl-CoA carboxylase carboxyltransferase component
MGIMSPRIGASVLTKHVEPQKKTEAMQETAQALELGTSVWGSAHEFWIDAIILPEETRKVVCRAFSFLGKQ